MNPFGQKVYTPVYVEVQRGRGHFSKRYKLAQSSGCRDTKTVGKTMQYNDIIALSGASN